MSYTLKGAHYSALERPCLTAPNGVDCPLRSPPITSGKYYGPWPPSARAVAGVGFPARGKLNAPFGTAH